MVRFCISFLLAGLATSQASTVPVESSDGGILNNMIAMMEKLVCGEVAWLDEKRMADTICAQVPNPKPDECQHVVESLYATVDKLLCNATAPVPTNQSVVQAVEQYVCDFAEGIEGLAALNICQLVASKVPALPMEDCSNLFGAVWWQVYDKECGGSHPKPVLAPILEKIACDALASELEKEATGISNMICNIVDKANATDCQNTFSKFWNKIPETCSFTLLI